MSMNHRYLLDNIKAIYKRISHAAMRAGRGPEEITLIAVTKGVNADAMIAAVEAGLRDFGESRMQAAQNKIPVVLSAAPFSAVCWHMIGHLQKNKVKHAVDLFDMIHSVDSLELAQKINVYARERGKIQKVLIQVKLENEDSKYGISEDKLLSLIKEVQGWENLVVEGLMTIPPFCEDADKTRPYFRRLRELQDTYGKAGFILKELSMGMSHDFEVAVEEGATMVRIGEAIFGERDRTAV